MKVSIYVSLIALVGIASMQSASAQEGRGARFNYAPNVWKAESARVPKGYGEFADPQHNVRSGAVPSKSLLGLDPLMTSKPAPVTALPPPMPVVSAQAALPKATPSFMPAFGKPMMAQAMPLPTMPQTAVAQPTINPNQAQPAKSAPAARVVHTGLSGRVRVPSRSVVTPASATPAIASYGNNVGYDPGAYLPKTGGGSSASTRLNGVLLTPVKNHK